MIKRPINIFYEIILYCIFIVGLLYVSKYNLINEYIIDFLWSYGIGSIFVILTIAITIRAVKKDKDKLITSACCFGFFVGVFLWTLYVVNEARSEKALIDVKMLGSILLVGITTAVVAAVISFLSSLTIKRLRGHSNKK